MPDVVSEAATLSLSQMEDLIEDDHHPVHGDPMLSHHLLNSPQSPSSPSSSLHSSDINSQSNGIGGHTNNLNGNCNITNGTSDITMQHCDPLLSSSHHHNQSHSQNNNNHHHMDISSCIGDSILTSTHNLLSSPHRSHVDSILSSPDTDSLVSDIDMVA